jgi:preprotein translocase subunit SecE
MGAIDRENGESRVRKENESGFMTKIVEDTKRFLKEVKIEMTKVTWPTWPELKGSTVLVILVSVFFAVYIGAIDLVLSKIINLF